MYRIAFALVFLQLLSVACVYFGFNERFLSLHQNAFEHSLCKNNTKTIFIHEADESLLRARIKHMIDDAYMRNSTEPLRASQEQPQISTPITKNRSCFHLSDEKYGSNPSSNVPGVEDIHEELEHYTKNMLEQSFTPDLQQAVQHQHRTTVEDIGFNARDPMNELDSISTRVEFLNELAGYTIQQEHLRVAIATTTTADIYAMRRELLPFLQYHTDLGITHFYILYDGNDEAAVRILQSIRHVELIHIHSPWATSLEVAMYHSYEEALKKMRMHDDLPGNYALMRKQGYCQQEALRRSKAVAFHWLLHIDPDELFYPGGGMASITHELAQQPESIPAVRFLNFEGQPEAGDIQNRFEQVTLFRVHKHYITPEAFFYRNRFKLGTHSAFLFLYANGKSAVRVSAPGSTHAGPHYFTGHPSLSYQTPSNPHGDWVNAVSDRSIILHYAYSYMTDVARKASHSCPNDSMTQHALETNDYDFIKKRCFIIDFDFEAFVAASKGNKSIEEFYYTNMVLSEGSVVECAQLDGDDGGQHQDKGWCNLRDIPRFIYLMEKLGLMKRVLMPQVVLRNHERSIQQRLMKRK